MKLTSWGDHYYNAEEAEVLIKKCLGHGIDTFDTADIYGHHTVEVLLGQALARDPSLRAKIKIITKCGIKLVCDARPQYAVKSYDSSTTHILESVANSLKSLQTTYIDVLLIHRPDPFTHPSEIAKAFTQLKAEGKVQHFGVSNYTPTQIDALRAYLHNIPLVTNQIEFSVFHTEPLFDGTFDKLFEHKITPQIWAPFGGNGKLFDAQSVDAKILRLRKVLVPIAEKHNTDIDVVTLAWVLQHPSNPHVLIGTTKWDRVQKLLQARHVKLTREEWFGILEASTGNPVK